MLADPDDDEVVAAESEKQEEVEIAPESEPQEEIIIAPDVVPQGDEDFREYTRTHDPALRDALVLQHMNLVRFLAKKFANRGETIDDLISVGTIGLLHAIDRFDPERGIRFATFATPTIVGEIKRNFRDKGWAIKVPRRLQEVNLAANRAQDKLTTLLNRPPTVQEVAAEIGVPVEETMEGMGLGHLYELASLDSELGSDDDDGRSHLADYVGREDAGFETLATRSRITSALRRLSPRERLIIVLRFFEGKSQTDVAKMLNISQMHVSRLQNKSLARLREMVKNEEV